MFAAASAVLALLTGLSGPPQPTPPPLPEGAYDLSDGFDYHASLELRPDGTFHLVWVGCLGPIADVTGTYDADSAVVHLAPSTGAFRRDVIVFSERMQRIRWANREYLVPDQRLLSFVNAINGGSEPRMGDLGLFYLKRGHDRLTVTGRPDLPPPWQTYLLPAALRGKVLRVLQRETKTIRPIVVVDAGSGEGLQVGMRLYAFNPRRPSFEAYGEVTGVSPHTAEVKVTLQYRHIRAGDSWSTRRPPGAAP